MLKWFVRPIVFSVLFLHLHTATATEINWSGFMSVAGGMTLDDGDEALVDPITDSSYDDEFRTNKETLVALQAQAVITNKLRAVVQTVGKSADNYEANIEWAYISYSLTPDLVLNAGRFRLPLFYYSDFLDVGYAYPWIRPPVEVYNAPTATTEGFNLYYSTLFDEVEFSTQFWSGGNTIKPAPNVVVDISKSYGLNMLFGWEWFKLRVIHAGTNRRVYVGDIKTEDTDITFNGIAFMADYNNFQWRSEKTQFTVGDDDASSWYASIGYETGDFTPMFTTSYLEDEVQEKSTNTLGIAWRFHPSITYKFEYAQSEITPAAGLGEKNDVDFISTSLDILF